MSATPGTRATRAASESGSFERVKSETSLWKSPKSARPTWISCSAVFRSPAAIDSDAAHTARLRLDAPLRSGFESEVDLCRPVLQPAERAKPARPLVGTARGA